MAIIDCTCKGINPNCEKCNGMGYYYSTLREGEIISGKPYRGKKRIKKVKKKNVTTPRKKSEDLIREQPIGDLNVRNIILTYSVDFKFLKRLLLKYNVPPLTNDTIISTSIWNEIKKDVFHESILLERKKIKKNNRNLKL